jgi:hypothetical protein
MLTKISTNNLNQSQSKKYRKISHLKLHMVTSKTDKNNQQNYFKEI